jgi:hypothetical protein
MVAPPGAEPLMMELRAGTDVAWSFHTMTTADTSSELARDTRSVLESVAAWEKVLAPPTDHRDAAYGPRLGEALAWAADLHAGQTRKGKPEPYLTHLLRVTGLVLRFGGSEDQAIAGALHDAPEDCGGMPVLAEIGRRYGTLVAEIVKDCSDSLVANPNGKAPWRERKIRHLHHLAQDGLDQAVLVTSCDKIANLEDLVEDLRRDGEGTLDRFNGGPDGTRAYYDAMFSLVGPRLPESARLQFARLLAELGVPEQDNELEGDPVSRFAAATEHLTAR